MASKAGHKRYLVSGHSIHNANTPSGWPVRCRLLPTPPASSQTAIAGSLIKPEGTVNVNADGWGALRGPESPDATDSTVTTPAAAAARAPSTNPLPVKRGSHDTLGSPTEPPSPASPASALTAKHTAQQSGNEGAMKGQRRKKGAESLRQPPARPVAEAKRENETFLAVLATFGSLQRPRRAQTLDKPSPVK
jgi:hypothetical protein